MAIIRAAAGEQKCSGRPFKKSSSAAAEYGTTASSTVREPPGTPSSSPIARLPPPVIASTIWPGAAWINRTNFSRAGSSDMKPSAESVTHAAATVSIIRWRAASPGKHRPVRKSRTAPQYSPKLGEQLLWLEIFFRCLRPTKCRNGPPIRLGRNFEPPFFWRV